MAEIAVFIKTFIREETFFNCIESVIEYMSDNHISNRLYIADDGEISEKKKKLYKNLRCKGHIILELPFNTGASKSRNLLLSELQDERYILRMDDDFELTNETNIFALTKILDKKSNIGVVADLERQVGIGKSVFSKQISPYQGFFIKKGTILVKKIIPLNKFDYFYVDGIKCAKCDFSRNMLLIRRDIFKEIKWEEKIKFAGEHLDFMLQIKHSTWDLVFTPLSIHSHREDIKNTNKSIYSKTKVANMERKNIYIKKWNIERITISRPILYIFKAAFLKFVNILGKFANTIFIKIRRKN